MSELDSTTSATRTCTKCGQASPATRDHFYARKRGKYGLHSWCKQCVAEYTRVYRAEHSEQWAAYRRAWRVKHPDEFRVYYAGHVEEYAVLNRDWRAKNPDKTAAYDNNRRAHKLGNGGTHAAEDIKAQYERQKGRCFYCDERVGEKYHRDHVIPLSKGGSNGPENLVIACPTCNLSKHDKHPQDFCGRLL